LTANAQTLEKMINLFTNKKIVASNVSSPYCPSPAHFSAIQSPKIASGRWTPSLETQEDWSETRKKLI
jgi:hypothetical protein